MIIYNDNEAQQNFSEVLEQAAHETVFVKRTDGLSFAIVLQSPEKSSPFAVAGVKTSVTTADILEVLREAMIKSPVDMLEFSGAFFLTPILIEQYRFTQFLIRRTSRNLMNFFTSTSQSLSSTNFIFLQKI